MFNCQLTEQLLWQLYNYRWQDLRHEKRDRTSVFYINNIQLAVGTGETGAPADGDIIEVFKLDWIVRTPEGARACIHGSTVFNITNEQLREMQEWYAAYCLRRARGDEEGREFTEECSQSTEDSDV